MNRCAWAGCRTFPYGVAGGWALCRPHIYEHNRLAASDVTVNTVLGPLTDDTPPPSAKWLQRQYSGALEPSGNFLPVLAVLNRRPIRIEIAS